MLILQAKTFALFHNLSEGNTHFSGYSQWQVDNDSGSDVIEILNVKDEVHGIGGQVGMASVQRNASLTFRYISEYNAEARYKGDLYTLTLVKGF